MKILLVNKFHYRKGGSETYYFALADALRDAGHEVLFFAMESEKNLPCQQEKYFVSNVEYNGPQGAAAQLKSAAKLLYSFEAKKKFAQLLEAEKPDIVHMNLVHRQITLSIVDVCKKAGVPVVFTQHDLICVCPNYTCLAPDGICEECLGGNFMPCVKKGCVKGSKAKSLLGAAEAVLYKARGSYNKIDLYITPSAWYRGLLEKAAFTKAPILHMTNFLPLGTRYEARPARNEDLLYLGRLSREKGLATLLRAMALCPGARLKIAGDGPQKEELEALAKELQLGERVEFLGFVSGQPLQELVAGCKAVVLPSEWYENGPYSVMEALAAGKPVLGSRIGGIPELVKDGQTGFTFEAGSAEALAGAVEKLLALPAGEYEALCAGAVEFAREKFGAEGYRDKLLELYSGLLKR
ncbi:MAG: glycosyltransferase family 4 protein [Oscillospiraceae bacterium]|nr:glycosyltransferase family 4 protein [Oscillospiraceae bacterium]